MPRYRVVNSQTFAHANLYQVGDELDYAGWPGSSLDPADSVAKRIKDYYAAHRNDRSLPKAPSLAQFADPPPTEQPTRAVLVPSTEPKPAPEPKPKKRPGRKPAVKEPNDG